MATGVYGPGDDAVALILLHLNRQDRYIARRTCQAQRRELGAMTSTLELGEDDLPAADLAASFPSLRKLVLRGLVVIGPYCGIGWERFCAFAARNCASLAQLQHLYGLPLASSTLATLARTMPSLQSLRAEVHWQLEPSSLTALSGLGQLTSLRLSSVLSLDSLPGAVVNAAPQLQELWLGCHTKGFKPCQLGFLTSLGGLRSLQLDVEDESVLIHSYHEAVYGDAWPFTALRGLTHLGLCLRAPFHVPEESLAGMGLEPQEVGLLQAVGRLTGLSSLDLDLSLRALLYSTLPLGPLAALQALTALRVHAPQRRLALGERQARVLAGLPQLRRLEACFASSAAAAAAGLARLEECRLHVQYPDWRGEVAAVAVVAGRGALNMLSGFDISSVHTLSLESCIGLDHLAFQAALQTCRSLRALCCSSHCLLHPAAVLQAIAALPELRHLSLCPGSSGIPEEEHLFDYWQMDRIGTALVALAACPRLEQLTLVGMEALEEDTLVALMRGLTRLRLLRLLGCNAAVSQERCQALVGQLGLWQLQVDVVRDMWQFTGQHTWMITELEERWAEGV